MFHLQLFYWSRSKARWIRIKFRSDCSNTPPMSDHHSAAKRMMKVSQNCTHPILTALRVSPKRHRPFTRTTLSSNHANDPNLLEYSNWCITRAVEKVLTVLSLTLMNSRSFGTRDLNACCECYMYYLFICYAKMIAFTWRIDAFLLFVCLFIFFVFCREMDHCFFIPRQLNWSIISDNYQLTSMMFPPLSEVKLGIAQPCQSENSSGKIDLHSSEKNSDNGQKSVYTTEYWLLYVCLFIGLCVCLLVECWQISLFILNTPVHVLW